LAYSNNHAWYGVWGFGRQDFSDCDFNINLNLLAIPRIHGCKRGLEIGINVSNTPSNSVAWNEVGANNDEGDGTDKGGGVATSIMQISVPS
jgi:hypothetical protein